MLLHRKIPALHQIRRRLCRSRGDRPGGKRDLFIETVRTQNAFYHALYAKLKPYVFETERELAADPKNHSLLDGWAKEDARYVVSLATEGQLGLTINARNLEWMIRRFAAETFGRDCRDQPAAGGTGPRRRPVSPPFTEATPYDAKTAESLREAAEEIFGWSGGSKIGRPAAGTIDGSKNTAATERAGVRLMDATPAGDDRILAALLHSASGRPYDRCLAEMPAAFDPPEKIPVSPRLRAPGILRLPAARVRARRLTFELVLSASAFAQLKRHRMATLTTQDYDPALGVTVPPSIEAVGAKDEFMGIVDRTNEAYLALHDGVGPAAAYVLTNAHRRRVLLNVNLRELYHLVRLREDAAAQWDIRRIAAAMTKLARARLPLTGMLLGGKDAYPDLYAKVFGRPPRHLPPKIGK